MFVAVALGKRCTTNGAPLPVALATKRVPAAEAANAIKQTMHLCQWRGSATSQLDLPSQKCRHSAATIAHRLREILTMPDRPHGRQAKTKTSCATTSSLAAPQCKQNKSRGAQINNARLNTCARCMATSAATCDAPTVNCQTICSSSHIPYHIHGTITCQPC